MTLRAIFAALLLALAAGCTTTYSVKVAGSTVGPQTDAALRIDGHAADEHPAVAPGVYVIPDEVGRDARLTRAQFMTPADVPVKVLLHLRDATAPIELPRVRGTDLLSVYEVAGESEHGPAVAVTVRVEPPGKAPLERRFAITGDEPTYNGAAFGFTFIVVLP